MSRLSDFKVLTFDIYGTIIDWERGALAALKPILEKNGKGDMDGKQVHAKFQPIQARQQAETPDMIYSDLLATTLPPLCEALELQKPTDHECKAFGASVASWPAFPDSVEALKRLSQTFKLVVLSNVDNTSFAGTVAGPLQGFQFDMILTAQDIGSYKPSLKNFEYMLDKVGSAYGAGKDQVLQTAQSQFHDHHPAHQMGMKSCWIFRPGAVMGSRDDPVWDWKFDTLGEMADAVGREAAGGKG